MTEVQQVVTGGVDTHKDTHVAAALDPLGRLLGTASFPTGRAGYQQLLEWLTSHGTIGLVGVEGTGSYGAGLAEYLRQAHVEVVEVTRPNRQRRRKNGKSDTSDAVAAARAVLSGEAEAVPKDRSGPVAAIRFLQVAVDSTTSHRTRIANQVRDILLTAPETLRAELRSLSSQARMEHCAAFSTGIDVTDPEQGARLALKTLAQIHLDLGRHLDVLHAHLDTLTASVNPALRGVMGVGVDTAATLLIVAGDNPHRLRSSAAFAALCGASPVEASSGKTIRHRLNLGGDRHANSALWRIVFVRMSHDPTTKAYVARRTALGSTRKEIIRCLMRYVAREIHAVLVSPPDVISGQTLRHRRTHAGLSLREAAAAVHSYPTRISELERGRLYDNHLAHRCDVWLTHHAA